MYEHRILNSVGVLLVPLTHVAIQVAYCLYMLTPCMECLWYCTLNFDTFFEARRSVDRLNDQRTSYGAKDKHSLVQ